MGDCCANKSCELEQLARSQGRVLWTVLAINAFMFVVEAGAAWLATSVSLAGDSLDMLGDAIAYGTSLYVLSHGSRAKIRAARVKGAIMAVTGLSVLGRALHQAVIQPLPDSVVMGPIATLALLANLVCLVALTRHRHDDLNMSSIWLCSRNDIIANGAVLAAAWLVHQFQSPWPDLVVGLGITVLFLKSAATVFSQARQAEATTPTRPLAITEV